MTSHRSVNDIPWSFLDPDAEWVAWQNRIAAFEQENAANLAEITLTLTNSPSLSPVSRTRLEHLKSAHESQSKILKNLLQEFHPFDSRLYDVTLALRSRLTRNHGLLSYTSNILRDWASFGAEENKSNFELLSSLLGTFESKNALVVGAGAGRLAYDFHQRLTKGSTTALDHNPLLLSFAKKMSEGSAISWVEFPQNPSSPGNSSVIEECRAPAPSRPGLNFILGDILANTLAGKSHDLILTPWVIDILPEPFEILSLRINSLLSKDGVWINYGPLAFSRSNPLERHSKSEILEILLNSGFKVEHEQDSELPYLKSPHHRGYRMETVFGFRAGKVSEKSPPPPRSSLPDYLLNPDLPVPLVREIAELKQKSMIFGTVSSWIDGKRSLRQLAGLLQSEYGIPGIDAELALKKFLMDRGH
jgi:hypothetical protein